MPSLATDRRYGVFAGLAIKAPAAVATTGAIALTGLSSIDAVAVAAGDRVLVKDQVDRKANGIYVADTGDWRRAADFDGARDAVTGTKVYVVGGAANGGREFVLTAPDPVVIGETDLTFVAAAALASAANTIAATRAIAAAGQSIFSLSHSVNAVLVTVNGAVVDEADFTADDGVTIGFLEGLNAGDAVVAYSLNGGVNSPTAAFCARLAATKDNVTGAGSVHGVLFDAVDFDDGGGDYDVDTGAFTAPKPGRYQLNAAVTLQNISAAAEEIELMIATPERDFFARRYQSNALPEQVTMSLSVLANLDLGAAASVSVRVAGEASDSVDLIGGADGHGHFSGFLVR